MLLGECTKRRERREYIEVGGERVCTGERVRRIVREDVRERRREWVMWERARKKS